MPHDISNLLIEFWHDLQQPDLFWQVGALLVCLVIAFFVDRQVRGRAEASGRAWRFGQGGLQRLAYPVVALVLVLVTLPLLRHRFPVHLLLLAVPLLASLAVIRIVFYVLRQTFGSSGWLASFERAFSLVVWGVVALHITGLLPDLIDMMEAVVITVGKQKLNLWMVLQGLVTVLATLLVALWVSGLIEARLMSAADMDSNLRVVFTRLSKALLLLLAVLIGLPLVGIDLTTLSVFSGAFGVGLGFGLQKIASNYVSGFIILLDRSIRIGNVISVGAERGQVTRITTRYTVLKGLSGVEAIVPNEVLVGSVVLNESFSDPRIRISLQIQVAYASDVGKAMEIMLEAAARQSRVLADPAPKAFLAAFGDSGISLELGFWIADPQEGTLQIRSDINLARWAGFQAAGIEIPYPQREVRLLGTGV